MKELKDKIIKYFDELNHILDSENNKERILNKRHQKFKQDEKKELMTGIIVVLLIIILIFSISYYFLIFAPQQEELENAKQDKINEVNSLLKEDDGQNQQALILEIQQANSIEELDRINVEDRIYPILKSQLLNQVQQMKDKYGRIEIQTSNSSDIMNIKNATNYINSADTHKLAQMSIKTVDSVIIPLSINRKQAASGLITEGNTVDIYKTNIEQPHQEEEDMNQTLNNTTAVIQDENAPMKIVGGSVVVSILRSKDSGNIEQNLELSQSPKSRNYSQSNTLDIQQVMSAKAAGTYSEKQLKVLLEDYGERLSNYERTSHIGELDVEYIIMLEVPRDSVEYLIENMDNIILTIPTYDAPSWVNLY
ncbi:MAG: DUF515 domain-containing protein [Methanosphaera sp.]|nr:DUF515 domain-containing protein [Methanosphaera sp.]